MQHFLKIFKKKRVPSNANAFTLFGLSMEVGHPVHSMAVLWICIYIGHTGAWIVTMWGSCWVSTLANQNLIGSEGFVVAVVLVTPVPKGGFGAIGTLNVSNGFLLSFLCSPCCVTQTQILLLTLKQPECSARTSVSTTAKFVRLWSRAGQLIKTLELDSRLKLYWLHQMVQISIHLS